MSQTNTDLLWYLKPEIVDDASNYAHHMLCQFVAAFIQSPKVMRENGRTEELICISMIRYIDTLLERMDFIKENSHGTLLVDHHAFIASEQDHNYCNTDYADYVQPKLLTNDVIPPIENLIVLLVNTLVQSTNFLATAQAENQDKRQKVEKILAYVKKLIQNLDDVDTTDNGTMIIDDSWRYREPPKAIHEMSIQEKYDYVLQEYGIPDLRLIGED